jgi:hypothetical protein
LECEHTFVSRYDEQEAREAVALSLTFSDALRRLGLRPAGGNHRVLKRWLAEWGISTAHFDPDAVRRRGLSRDGAPLEELMTEHSTYSRGTLKRRLYSEGYKARTCELCGQGELWHGRRMALILDHINGVADDHRLENLRIVCANCAATLPTHCGANNRLRTETACALCGVAFLPSTPTQRFCGRDCGQRSRAGHGAIVATRRVERPPYAQLRAEVDAEGWSATGRRYGVSDNAVRKWMRMYEREATGPPSEPGPA